MLDSERFRDESPAAVYATLLDEGRYLSSISTMYRVLREAGEVRERRRQASPPATVKPELVAQRPNQVWSWDISKLLGPQKWTYYYLYVVIDISAAGWWAGCSPGGSRRSWPSGCCRRPSARSASTATNSPSTPTAAPRWRPSRWRCCSPTLG